jgi:hypothetical protein
MRQPSSPTITGPTARPFDRMAAYSVLVADAALLLLFRRLSLPRFETWVAFPSNEEIGAVGAAYLVLCRAND